MRERLLHLWRNQEGISLAELGVAMGLMAIIATMYISSVLSVQDAVMTSEIRSRGNDSVRVALQQMDREIRSGNVVYDPALETPVGHEGYVLRLETQANGSTRVPPTQCVRYRVIDQKLERQSYYVSAGVAQVVSNWRLIAEGIMNRDVTPKVLPFSLSEDGRTVNIVMLANLKPSDLASRTVQLQTSVAIRNSTPTVDPCSPTPPWGS